MEITPDATWIAAVAAGLLSLIFSYIPGIADWYNGKDGTFKRLFMLVALLLVTVASFALSCAGILRGITCDQTGAVAMLQAFILALVVNQSVDRVSPPIGAKA